MDRTQEELIAKRLAEISKRDRGVLTPDAVVEDARDPKSPMHSYFTWDDDEAARRYRLDQARTLIRTIEVRIKTHPRVITSVGYVRDPYLDRNEQGYRAITELKKDRDRAVEALRAELVRAEGCMARAMDVADALGLTHLVEPILRDIRKARGATDEAA